MKLIKIASKYDILFDMGQGSRKVGESEGSDPFHAINRFWEDHPEFNKDYLFAQKHDNKEEKLRNQYEFLKRRYGMRKTFEEWLKSRERKKDLAIKKQKIQEQEESQGKLF